MGEQRGVMGRSLAGAAGLVGVILLSAVADGATPVVSRMAPAGDAIELEIPTEAGLQKDVIPLYRSGGIPYFSAGVGRVEREAVYPPFSLKLVFTAGGKPFVTGATVTVRDREGTKILTVPADENNGPWLFIDLPEGTYDVSAMLGGQRQEATGIRVKPDHTTTHYVRWEEDHSPALIAQPE